LRGLPIQLTRDEKRRWLLAQATGVLSLDEVLRFMYTARADVETRMLPLMFDARSATTAITTAEVDAAVELVSQLTTEGPRGHVALVAHDDRLYEMMLLYETKCTAIGVRLIRVFRQMPDADRWLTNMSATRHLR
jgi:hypothetical protein